MSKLTYEDKINLYNDKKRGMSIGSLSNKYKIRKSVINYLTALIDKHGIDILRTSKNKLHTKYEKQEAIELETIHKLSNFWGSVHYISIFLLKLYIK